MKKLIVLSIVLALAAAAAAQAKPETKGAGPKPPTTREMNLLCWQEFGELVLDTIAKWDLAGVYRD